MRVLLATDLSRPAGLAAKLVTSLAWPSGTTIRVLGVIEPITAAVTLLPERTALTYDEDVEREFAEAVEAVAQELRADGREVMSVTKLGRAADAIVDEAERFEADLIILGSRGRGAIRSALLGSVSAEVVDRAKCPVLVARRDQVTRIVFGDDGAPRTRQAAAVLSWPVFTRLPIRVVSTSEVTLPYEAATEDRAAFEEAVRVFLRESHAAHEVAERVAKESAARLVADGLQATSEAREGAASAGIVSAAAAFDADLVVIGSRGDRGFTRMLIGSAAREVLYHAACSVLIAKQQKPATDEARESERAAATSG